MPKFLNILPPEHVKTKYSTDYRRMKDSMIYGNSLTFNQLILRLEELNRQIKGMQF